MIVDFKSGKMSLIGCKEANLWPLGDNRFLGELAVGDDSYEVVVVSEDERIQVYVNLVSGIPGTAAREKAALELARRGLADPVWRPLAVDSSDGEVIYTSTLTCDKSVEAVDRVLASARAFIEEHGREFASIVDCPDEDEDGVIELF